MSAARKEKKSKQPANKYSQLIEASGLSAYRFENSIFLHPGTRTVIGTDGRHLIARRDLYPESAVIARVQGLPESAVMTVNADGLLVSADRRDPPEFSQIIPTAVQLQDAYSRAEVNVPKWIGRVHKAEEKLIVTLIPGEDPAAAPVIAIGVVKGKGVTLNAIFLRSFVGADIDVYLHKTEYASPIVVVPRGKSIDDAEWFSLIMPIRQ